MKIKKVFKISLIKTIRFNYHYFGIKGIFKHNAIVFKNVKFRELKGNIILKDKDSKIKIGYSNIGVLDEKYNRVIWENSGTIIFEGNARIGSGSKIINKGELILGKNFSINGNASIICYKKIKFGDNCLISWNTLFMDTDFHSIYNEEHIKINEDKEIDIGNNVWIGCNSTILKGVIIGNNIVIGTGSIVTKNLTDSNSIYCSNERVKKNIVWKY